MVEKEHEVYVSLEIARLLRKTGFNWPCKTFLMRTVEDDFGKVSYLDEFFFASTDYPLNWNDNVHAMSTDGEVLMRLSAPTLQVAQRWLREEKDFCVNVYNDTALHPNEMEKNVFVSEVVNCRSERCKVIRKLSKFKTYEDALEDGILNCLAYMVAKRKY